MAEKQKDQLLEKIYPEGSSRAFFQCLLCEKKLSTKQRIFTHLNKIHNKSPLKKVYQRYTEDPLIAVPRRTIFRHSARDRNREQNEKSKQTDFGSTSQLDETVELNYVLMNENEQTVSPTKDPEPLNDLVTLFDNDEPETMIEAVIPHDNHHESTKDDGVPIDNNDSLETEGVGITLNNDSFDNEYISESSSDDNSLSDSYESTSNLSDSDFNYPSSSSETDLTEEELTYENKSYTSNDLQALCVSSFLLKHNLSASAAKDMLQLLPILNPSTSDQSLTYNKVMSITGDSANDIKDYCYKGNNLYTDNKDIFHCPTEGCNELRYKGNICDQSKSERQPRNSFVIADIKKQLKFILERKGLWVEIQKLKEDSDTQSDAFRVISDITDGQYYRYLCEEDNFLNDKSNISAILNTDGIPLYNSSNVKLWPIYLCINELPKQYRFSRENMILAAIWQGKGKPPFQEYISSVGKELSILYEEGFEINIGQNPPQNVRLGVFLATLDLQAKGYVLNQTMHNGQYGCATCEDPGQTVRQGRGYARTYAYKPSDERCILRDSDDIKNVKAPNASSTNRVKGICGKSGLSEMSFFNLVTGIVPDYMHGVLLGVTKTLLQKFFSPSNSTKPYFVGKDIKLISAKMQGISPPECIERMPRDLEKNYCHFKATELQTWLLFYAVPCLKGYLNVKYLEHLSWLSEGIYLLLGDNISEDELQRAEVLLDKFYQDFSDLYGEGSCGLNVHNIGCHLVFYVRMWGPLWAWSCFPFEDWNAALLQSVHGTGDVTKQAIKMREVQVKLANIDLKDVPKGKVHDYLQKMKRSNKSWASKNVIGKVTIAGCEQSMTLMDNETETMILQSTDSNSLHNLKKALRIKVGDQKFHSKGYSRMKKRICYIVKCKNGNIIEIDCFIVNKVSSTVFALAKHLILDDNCFMFREGPHHILKVKQTNEIDVVPVTDLVEKMLLMNIDEVFYVACMPNIIGRSVLM